MDIFSKPVAVPEFRKEKFLKTIAQLNRKIRKLNEKGNNFEEIKVNFTGDHWDVDPRYFLMRDENGAYIKDSNYEKLPRLRYIDLVISGTMPSIKGWDIIGKVEHEDGYNIVHGVPGVDVPVKYQDAKPDCQHCNLARSRRITYVVQNKETKEYLQIGSTCLQDYFKRDVDDFISYMEYLAAIDFDSTFDLKEESMFDDDPLFRGGSSKYSILEDYLNLVAYCIRLYGWVPKSQEDEQNHKFATATTARELLILMKSEQQRKQIERSMIPEDRENAKKAIEWGKSIPKATRETNNFMHNLWVICMQGLVKSNNLGYACLILVRYFESIGEIQLLTMKTIKKNEFFGEVGGKYRMLLFFKIKNFVGKVYIQNKYEAYLYSYKFFDENGFAFGWLTTTEKPIEDGEWYIVDFTVKKHNEYESRGVLYKETQIERPKFQQVDPEAISWHRAGLTNMQIKPAKMRKLLKTEAKSLDPFCDYLADFALRGEWIGKTTGAKNVALEHQIGTIILSRDKIKQGIKDYIMNDILEMKLLGEYW